MEVSALRYSGGVGLHGPSALLRLQSDERLISIVRRGNPAGFEVLVSRYQARLLAFCRHLLGSREDAEDVLQEVLAAAFNAILADERAINVRPWLYRIARNRCLNHLRRIQAVGVDSMDVHLSEHGASTADKVHKLEEFRMLVGDIHELPETQKTALVLREMDALSYEQIAEAMETTVPSVKSLLVRARMSLAEAAEARMLSCEDVRVELAEIAEGLRRRPTPLVRRHLRACKRCSMFQVQLKETSKALTALLPIGPFVLLKKLALTHIGHSASAGAGAGSGASGAGAAGSGAAFSSTAAAGAAAGPSAGGLLSVGAGTIATKAAAGLAAAAIVTAGAVEVSHSSRHRLTRATTGTQIYHGVDVAEGSHSEAALVTAGTIHHAAPPATPSHTSSTHPAPPKPPEPAATTATTTAPAKHPPKPATDPHASKSDKAAPPAATPTQPPGRTATQSQTTYLPPPSSSSNSNSAAQPTTDTSGSSTSSSSSESSNSSTGDQSSGSGGASPSDSSQGAGVGLGSAPDTGADGPPPDQTTTDQGTATVSSAG